MIRYGDLIIVFVYAMGYTKEQVYEYLKEIIKIGE